MSDEKKPIEGGAIKRPTEADILRERIMDTEETVKSLERNIASDHSPIGEWDLNQIYASTLAHVAGEVSDNDTRYSSATAIADHAHNVALAVVNVARIKGGPAFKLIRKELFEEAIADRSLSLLRMRATLARLEEDDAPRGDLQGDQASPTEEPTNGDTN